MKDYHGRGKNGGCVTVSMVPLLVVASLLVAAFVG